METIKRFLKLSLALSVVALMTACAVPTKKAVDYTAFKAAKPRSIVVLPPLNESPEVKAPYGLMAQVTRPLAEAGYYVLPVSLVDETFKHNGLTVAADIHQVSVAKLHDIFGADAVLYVTIKQYGTQYMVVDSATVVSAAAKLVDLRTGDTLWSGAASASSNEGNNNSSGGLIGMLVSAAVRQVLASATDAGFQVAGTASARLLTAGQPNGILFGPRSPKYGTD